MDYLQEAVEALKAADAAGQDLFAGNKEDSKAAYLHRQDCFLGAIAYSLVEIATRLRDDSAEMAEWRDKHPYEQPSGDGDQR